MRTRSKRAARAFREALRRKRQFESLESRLILSGTAVIISEFMAENESTLADEDGAFTDWIELTNISAEAVNLADWGLTDDPTDLYQWELPSITLSAGEQLVVFASGKDRAVAGAELHANFQLESTGEYLALTPPDDDVPATEFAPEFPRQLVDVSFGTIRQDVDPATLIDDDTAASFAGGQAELALNWTSTAFDDASWTTGLQGVGYATAAEPALASAIALDVEGELLGQNASGYVRLPFTFDGLPSLEALTLDVRYDAGFVAYLNGTEIVRRNAPSEVQWNSAATSERANAAALAYEQIDIAAFAHLLLDQDANILAIHGLNSAAGDADFLIDARLTAIPVAEFVRQYFTTPTAGADNVPGTLGFVEDTSFSVDRGFFTEPFVVEINTDTAGAEIRYTIDGKPPTATTGLVYAGPIAISDTTTLRAAAYKPGFMSTNVDTQTYLFLNSVLQQDGVGLAPFAPWGHAGADWTVDPDIVNHADPANRLVPADLQAVPTVSLVMPWGDWFDGARGAGGIYIQGTGVEKAASVEWIQPSGESAFQIDAAVQIQGGSSADRWKDDKLSMRLKFKQPYGPTKLDYPVFDGAVESFDTLILDGVLNYSWVHSTSSEQRLAAKYIQDQYVADLQNAMGGQGPHGRAVHLYLNGLYWGMYIAHERPDETFAADYLGGDKDDYDVMKHRPSTSVAGSTANYAELLNLARQNLAVDANYQNLANKLDIAAFADYMLLNFFVGNTDWAHQNWYASYNRVAADGKWRFHSWDAEHVLKTPNENILSRNDTGGPTEIHQRLLANPEYKVRFGDRARQHLFNDGALTAANAKAMYQARVTEIDRAIVGESARWGDNSEASPRTRAHWLATQQQLLTGYFPLRTGNVINQLRSAGLYSALEAPSFNQHGGIVSSGFPLTMTGPANSTIYYTLDGADPRLPGGQVNAASALIYNAAVPLTSTGAVFARTFSNGQWSSLNQATFVVGQPTLAVVELNYHPYPAGPGEPVVDDGEFEFLELLNTGALPVSLYGVRLSGVEFNFGTQTPGQLAPGVRAVLVKNVAAFTARYGDEIAIAGTFTGSLSNSGETIELRDALDGVIQAFAFDDGGDWPGRADGDGSSLEIINPAGDFTAPGNWRSSSEYGGTPGGTGAGPRNDVVISEVLARTTNGVLDAIELRNTTSAAMDISGWLLSDSNENYRKFIVPDGTAIPAGGYRVFDEDDFNATPGEGSSFALDGLRGEDLWLLAGEDGRPTQFVDHVEFVATPDGVALGRWPENSGLLFPMTSPTLGAANAGPALGAVIVSEIMYDPSRELDDDGFEFVELYNRGGAAVDLGGWRLAGGVDFALPSNTILPVGGALTLVSFDPSNAPVAAAFRLRYAINDNVTLLGPYAGKLDNGGELLQLLRPDLPSASEPEFIPLVLVDQVDYDDDAPWPGEANGSGQSLARTAADDFGGLPESWLAASPDPGDTDFTVVLPGDTNGDGNVNLVDLNNVRNHFGANGPGVLGDTNGDGQVNLVDLNAVRNNFGAGNSPLPVVVPAATPHGQPAVKSASRSGLHRATDVVFQAYSAETAEQPWLLRASSRLRTMIRRS